MNIIYLVKKEARQMWVLTAAFVVAAAVMAGLAYLMSQRMFSMFAVFLYGLLVLGVLMVAERYEERSNGYRFLVRMPVLPAEIAAGKHIAVFLVNLIACVVLVAVSRTMTESVVEIQRLRSVIYLFGCLWLLVVPLMYWGICVFGYTKFVLIFRITIMALLVGAQLVLLLMFRSRGKAGEIMASISQFVTDAPWFIVGAIVSVLYFVLVPVTGRLVRRYASLQ